MRFEDPRQRKQKKLQKKIQHWTKSRHPGIFFQRFYSCFMVFFSHVDFSSICFNIIMLKLSQTSVQLRLSPSCLRLHPIYLYPRSLYEKKTHTPTLCCITFHILGVDRVTCTPTNQPTVDALFDDRETWSSPRRWMLESASLRCCCTSTRNLDLGIPPKEHRDSSPMFSCWLFSLHSSGHSPSPQNKQPIFFG